MFVAVLFIPIVAGNVFVESSSKRVPQITERSGFTKPYTIFDPCNLKKPGRRTVSCAQLKREGNDQSQDYLITPHNTFYVWCDMDTDGGGWTIIQRRSSDEEGEDKFEKSAKEYEEGFYGGVSSYWIDMFDMCFCANAMPVKLIKSARVCIDCGLLYLKRDGNSCSFIHCNTTPGNDNIHALTSHPNNEQFLRIELTKQNQETIVANYGKFKVGSKKDGYVLTYEGFWSPNGSDYDGLAFHNRTKFRVMKESDRIDQCSKSRRSGGWWFPPFGCLFSNLNGRKFKDSVPSNNMGHGITWYRMGDWSSYLNVYEKVEMKVRDIDYKFCTGEMAK